MTPMNMIIHPDVQKALNEKRPIVALESTIISHGMPYPENVKMAKNVEAIIRNEGAVPATIAILDGIIRIGLTEEEIETLATSNDVHKVGRRDFAYVISQKKHGATTVSGTTIVAEKVGIHVFATGGIGGVHRGASESFDISRDLEEVALSNVAIVCAGAKSILDLGLTMEYLETKGVEVIGYQTHLLPAFYARTSKQTVPFRLDSPQEIANLMTAKWQFGLKGGLIIANPIPEAYAMDGDAMERIIEQALEEAHAQGIKGHQVTPYLLSKIKAITKGDSLEANIALVLNNAQLAARIAVSYHSTT